MRTEHQHAGKGSTARERRPWDLSEDHSAANNTLIAPTTTNAPSHAHCTCDSLRDRATDDLGGTDD
ncbi:MAG: hypothetical protein AAGF11_45530 [Myxococcota bacterium]